MKPPDSRILAFTPAGNVPQKTNQPGGLSSGRQESQERRAYTRYQITTAAKVVGLQMGAQLSGRCSDISLGGCFIDTPSPFHVGTPVRVTLLKDEGSFSANAVVATSMNGMGMGLRFTAIEPDQRLILERWIQALGGDPHEGARQAQEAPAPAGSPAPTTSVINEVPYVLNELIIVLMRKGLLTEAQGKDMLRRLLS